MTTIRYWITDTAPAVTVARAGSWFAQTTSRTLPRAMVTARPAAGNGPGAATGTASGSLMFLQGIGPGGSLPVRTITGTFRTVLAPTEVFASTDSFGLVIVRVVSADGATVRGTLFSGSPALESGQPSTNYLSRTVSGPITPCAVQAGDRLVIEWGVTRAHSPGTNWPAAPTFESAGDVPFADNVLLGGTPGYTIWAELILDDPVLPPAGLAQVGATETSVDVDWSAPATGPVPTSYDIRIDGGAVTSIDPATVLAPGAFLTATGLAPSTAYLIEVRSVTSSSTSGWVSVVATTADPPPPPPLADPDRRWWTHRVAHAAGVDPYDGQPVVEVRLWDGAGFVMHEQLSRALQSYQVTYGRKDATSRTESVTASLVWATPLLPAGVDLAVATRLQVALSPAVCAGLGLDPVDGIRFTGEVTDPAVAYARRLTSAACAGRLGRAMRIPVDGTTWPVEVDGARVARILPAAGVGLQVGTIDAGTMSVAAPTRAETVATLLEQTGASTLGQVVEQPSGAVDWHDADHRRAPVVAVTLTAAQVLRDVTWTQRLASLVNDLSVKIPDGTVVRVVDPESGDVNRYGPWPASLDTILTNTSDAAAVGVDIVGRRADPAWQLPDLTVDLVRTIATPDLAGVLALRHGSLLEVTGLPVEFPNDGRVFVEGYTETATPRTWSLVLSVSDRLQSGVGIRWTDWPDTDAYQWQDLDPDLTWLDLARIYDPADTI